MGLGLNVRPETLKLLEGNMWKHFKISQKRALIAQEIIAKIDKWDYIRFKKIVTTEASKERA